ncbi:MAG TPA: S1 RNA-binding domain-containing protein, partial [Acidimicrobiia bacterium]|nr:S1 RNA-binding domain-containing protein [Acidimicrobiia bacterium]
MPTDNETDLASTDVPQDNDETTDPTDITAEGASTTGNEIPAPAPEALDAPDASEEAQPLEDARTSMAEEVDQASGDDDSEEASDEQVDPTLTPEFVDDDEAPEAAVIDAPRGDRPAISAPGQIGDVPNDLSADDFAAAVEQTVFEFKEGDIVVGTVVRVDPDEVLVDIGYKSEGVIPPYELSVRNNSNPDEIVKVGDKIEALVLQKEDDQGRLVLSKKRAQYERAWGRIEKLMNEGGTVTGQVIEVVKGGLIVDIGLRGFLPASLVDLRRVRDLQPFIGEPIEAKVIELDRNRNNVVLSRRAYLEEEQAEQRHAFLADLKEGDVREGVVSSVVNFGAFVDLGGMDGLVHVSELS